MDPFQNANQPPPPPIPDRGQLKRIAERFTLPCGTVVEAHVLERVIIRDDGILLNDRVIEVVPPPDFGMPFTGVIDAVRCGHCEALVSRTHTTFRCSCGEEFCLRCRQEFEDEDRRVVYRCPYCAEAMRPRSLLEVFKAAFKNGGRDHV